MQVSDTTDNMKGYTFVSSGSEWYLDKYESTIKSITLLSNIKQQTIHTSPKTESLSN